MIFEELLSFVWHPNEPDAGCLQEMKLQKDKILCVVHVLKSAVLDAVVLQKAVAINIVQMVQDAMLWSL